MQQPQIVEFMCLVNFAMSGSCRLSILAFAERAALVVVISCEDTLELLRSSCTTGLSIGGRPACKIQDVSMMLQVKNLHTRKGEAAPIPCFSAQFAVAMRDASRCGADEFAQIWIVGWEACMCCDFSVHTLVQFSGVANNHLTISSSWYDMHNLHHLLFLLEMSELCFQNVIFAARCWKCQFGNILLSVNLFVRTQQRSFKGSKNHQLGSHTTNGIHGQKRLWNCLDACKTINSGNAIWVQDRFFTSSKGTMFYLSDDHFVEDVVLPPFGLCHQRWTTISLSLNPQIQRRGPAETELGDGSSKSSAQSS